MGWGVEQHQTFEALTEARFNKQGGLGRYNNIEILNFAVPGYYPLQQRTVLEKTRQFSPNAVFYVATGREESRAVDYLVEVVQKEIDIPYPRLDRIVKQSAINASMDKATVIRNLKPYRSEILTWLYQDLVTVSKEYGAIPVWVFLPSIDKGSWLNDLQETETMARNAGFLIMNLNGVFDSEPADTLQLEEWDKHPNDRGHELIAEALYDAINQQRADLLSP